PLNAARRNPASLGPDVSANREMKIVALHAPAVVAGGQPELRESWILVDVRLAAHRFEQPVQLEMAADVHQQVGAPGEVQEIGAAGAMDRFAFAVNEGR